ncbi:hypothetical protein IT409_00085 [Candidatus Falkowbacteria bacterium]|nr:hypothetical protein [Candidatus Falkowbacteria bacterium]
MHKLNVLKGVAGGVVAGLVLGYIFGHTSQLVVVCGALGIAVALGMKRA